MGFKQRDYISLDEIESCRVESLKTVVVSDVHLGSENSDKTAFNAFLTSLSDDDEVTDLVLLGDIVDMWRRDASGVFLENMDTVQIIKELQKTITVHCVAGNHDYHLLKLKNRAAHYHYPLEFNETLELVDGEHTYRFMHGYEFEYGNELKFMRPVMEVLCHIMSDAEGVNEDELWVYLARKLSDLQYSVFTHHMEKDDMKMMARSLKDGPERRLEDKLEDVEYTSSIHQSRGKPYQYRLLGQGCDPAQHLCRADRGKTKAFHIR
jgi:UDP-2,3-diacylglucosamine pyrophosphatase LpxH